jgi:hypothetical protein
VRYYSRAGRPLTFEEWARSFENLTEEARRVAYDDLGDGVTVSTVWLGLDHRYPPDAGPPVIFETMIFGGPLDSTCWRYSTEEAARAGHDDAVRAARGTP